MLLRPHMEELLRTACRRGLLRRRGPAPSPAPNACHPRPPGELRQIRLSSRMLTRNVLHSFVSGRTCGGRSYEWSEADLFGCAGVCCPPGHHKCVPSADTLRKGVCACTGLAVRRAGERCAHDARGLVPHRNPRENGSRSRVPGDRPCTGPSAAYLVGGLHMMRADLVTVRARPMPPLAWPRWLRWLPHALICLAAALVAVATDTPTLSWHSRTLPCWWSHCAGPRRPGGCRWWRSRPSRWNTRPPPIAGSTRGWCTPACSSSSHCGAVDLRDHRGTDQRRAGCDTEADLPCRGLMEGDHRRYAAVRACRAHRRGGPRPPPGPCTPRRQIAATAQERALRTVLEERTRIARELHDVVAHHMSLISIKADAAPYRVQDPPSELVTELARSVPPRWRAGRTDSPARPAAFGRRRQHHRHHTPTLPRATRRARRERARRRSERHCPDRRHCPPAVAGGGAVGLPHHSGSAQQRSTPCPRC